MYNKIDGENTIFANLRLSRLKLIHGPQQHEFAWNYSVNNLKYIISPSISKSTVGRQKHIG